MGLFAETQLWRAARMVLPSDAAADSFCETLGAEWGHYHRLAQCRQAGFEGTLRVPLTASAGGPLLEAAAALYRFGQNDPRWQETRWASLNRKEKSAAWKRYDRLLNSGKAVREDVSRRRLLVRWTNEQVRKLGGGRLTYYTERPLATKGVKLVVEIFRFLGLGDENTSSFIVKELKRQRHSDSSRARGSGV